MTCAGRVSPCWRAGFWRSRTASGSRCGGSPRASPAINWLATLGRSPDGLHRFLAAYLRYSTHVWAYRGLLADPYPGALGRPGYPVDPAVPRPQPQRRWRTTLRSLLGLAAMIVAGL